MFGGFLCLKYFNLQLPYEVDGIYDKNLKNLSLFESNPKWFVERNDFSKIQIWKKALKETNCLPPEAFCRFSEIYYNALVSKSKQFNRTPQVRSAWELFEKKVHQCLKASTPNSDLSLLLIEVDHLFGKLCVDVGLLPDARIHSRSFNIDQSSLRFAVEHVGGTFEQSITGPQFLIFYLSLLDIDISAIKTSSSNLPQHTPKQTTLEPLPKLSEKVKALNVDDDYKIEFVARPDDVKVFTLSSVKGTVIVKVNTESFYFQELSQDNSKQGGVETFLTVLLAIAKAYDRLPSQQDELDVFFKLFSTTLR